MLLSSDVIVFVAEKRLELASSRVVNSTKEKIRKESLRSRPFIGVLQFMTNGKQRVVIRLRCVILAGGGGAARNLRTSRAVKRYGNANYPLSPLSQDLAR